MDYTNLTQQPNACEARRWLMENQEPWARTISGSGGSETAWLFDEALSVVNELYELGAVFVTAVEIDGRVEGYDQEDTSTLIVELPVEAAKRAALFSWSAEFSRSEGWDPTLDDGQAQMLVWRS